MSERGMGGLTSQKKESKRLNVDLGISIHIYLPIYVPIYTQRCGVRPI